MTQWAWSQVQDSGGGFATGLRRQWVVNSRVAVGKTVCNEPPTLDVGLDLVFNLGVLTRVQCLDICTNIIKI